MMAETSLHQSAVVAGQWIEASCNFIEKYVATPIDLQLDMVIF
jgi:hypothetical protein